MPVHALSIAKRRLRAWGYPHTPDEVRDDLALLRFDAMRAQVPLLYTTMMTVIVICATIAVPPTAPWLRWGIPALVVAIGSARLFWWTRRSHTRPAPAEARRRMTMMVAIASMLAGLCSSWTVIGWLGQSMVESSYYALFMTMGALSAAFCLSTHRVAAISVLVVGTAPLVAALVVAGDSTDRTAALLISLACVFLGRLILQRHAQLVTLLQLQRQTQKLANTDPLTGLANRRALFDRLESSLERGERPAIILFDLDGFKPINDTHGHGVGDALLQAVAGVLRNATAHESRSLTARLGGDEFAILLVDADLAGADSVAVGAAAMLGRAFEIGEIRIRIGASIGYAVADDQARDARVLIDVADARLYEAKSSRTRGRSANSRFPIALAAA